MFNKIYEELEKELKKVSRFCDSEGNVNKSVVQTSALNFDYELLGTLINNKLLKDTFFKNINGVLVFDKISFSWVITNNEFLPDSYTAFKNKIGLVDSSNSYISQSNDISLAFPYKDCLLEFDATDEDETRDEVFLNEILSRYEIDNLLSNKILSKPILHDGKDTNVSLYNDENLLIKGNNLIAMHSLKHRFKGRIKMMYWDILYNTNSDNVPYNDSFKHSSWLTMMKNRLDVAEKLLSNEGIIMIHLDANEMAYLKVLMDEVFDRKNYLGMFTCKVKAPSGVASGAQMIFDCSEYILVYAKKIEKVTYNHLQEEAEVVDENSKTASFYKYILESVSFNNLELVQDLGEEKVYRIHKKDFSIKTMNDQSAVSYYNNYKKIFRTAALSGGREKEIAKIVSAQPDALESLFVFEHVPNKGKRAGQLCRDLIYKNGGILMLSDFCKVDNKKKQIIKMQHITSIFANDWWQGISKEGDVTLNNGKKPEILLKTLIEMATNPGDIVLDAYFGTGTTGAVAMKLGRKFIGIEQLESHYEKSIHRLNAVIEGDKSGISKDVKWNGGGSYITTELLTRNASYIELIKTGNDDELCRLYDLIYKNPCCLNHKVDTNIKLDVDFKSLELDDKKKVLISMLDKNLLYVNYDEREDKSLNISDVDIAFSTSFYGE